MKTHPLHLFKVVVLLLLPKAANAQIENIFDGIFGFICILPIFDLFCNDCNPNPCLNNGVCTDEVGGYTCECAVGFSGDTCTTNDNECNPNPCLNDGVCTDEVGAFTCECAVGFSGETCATNDNDCNPNPCLNGGVCTDEVGGYTCECADGFSGETCATNDNDCNPNPCLNGGVCTDEVDGYTCECAVGFSGETCATNNNDCNPDPCLNGGVCMDEVDGYTCECADGFSGDTCEVECESGFLKEGGFSMFGPSLFLAPNTSPSSPGTPDLVGSVFFFERTQMLELGTNTPIEGQTVSGTCTRTTGSTDGGGFCSLVFIDDEGTTINVSGFLQVPFGIQMAITGGTGSTVGVTGTMDFSPIYNDGRVSDGDIFLDAGRYDVTFNAGVSYNCTTNDNDCNPNPCLNNGVCTDEVDGYTCECAVGFSGKNCATNDNDCNPNPCLNGGVCTDEVHGYTCECAGGFSGDTCEVECESGFLKEGGFSMSGPSLFLAPDTSPSSPGAPSSVGTVFYFERTPMLEFGTDTPIEGQTVSGSCTRTTVGTDGDGFCSLVFIDGEGTTINALGYLQGPFGSQLTITGGTGSAVGVTGTMDFSPIYVGGGVGDLFLDATRHDVTLNAGFSLCPP